MANPGALHCRSLVLMIWPGLDILQNGASCWRTGFSHHQRNRGIVQRSCSFAYTYGNTDCYAQSDSYTNTYRHAQSNTEAPSHSSSSPDAVKKCDR